jgi:hypothetical protein
MRIIRGFFYLVILLAVAVGALFVGARFNDGPIAIVPGGPLVAGTMMEDPVLDWSFMTDVNEIQMQLDYQNTSRTVWIVVHDNKAFIPCSQSFPPGKTWHRAALENGAALIRHDGAKYPVSLKRLEDEALSAAVGSIATEKYATPPGGGEVWFFALGHRTLS